MIIDTHCHLYLPEFSNEIDTFINSAKENGIKKIYLPAINSETTGALLSLEEKHPEICVAMMGLHPCYVKSDYKNELQKVEDLLVQRKFVAIGECGLDFYWDKTFIKEQYLALEQQVEWALHYNLPLILHTRNATQETIDVIKKYKSSNLKGIFHCFGGTYEEAKQIIDLGFYLGIGGVVTYKNAGLDLVLKNIDLDYLVLETDAPYLSPVPFRGKTNEPAHLKIIAEKIALIKNVSYNIVADITSKNAERLFGAEE
jgi:TatD DNase family protein